MMSFREQFTTPPNEKPSVAEVSVRNGCKKIAEHLDPDVDA